MLFKYGQQTAEQLKTLGTNIEFKSYKGMGHTVSKEHIVLILKWTGRDCCSILNLARTLILNLGTHAFMPFREGHEKVIKELGSLTKHLCLLSALLLQL